jgi:hypothetical protein
MSSPKIKKIGQYIKYAIVILAIVLVVLFVFFVGQYIALRRAHIISARESWLSAAIQKHGPATATDVNFIRSWMTFDYIDKLFDIPQDYLKTRLSITDARYPKLSISEYAGDVHLNKTDATGEVAGAVRDYLTNQPQG